MDHFFEQKTLRENQELNKQVFKLNKQVKELQERVLTYEQLFSQLDESIMSKLKTFAGSVLGNKNMQRKLPEPQQTVRGKMNNPALRPLRLDDDPKRDDAPRKPRGGPDIRVDDELKVDPAPKKPRGAAAPKKPRGKDLDLDDKPMDQKPFKPRQDDLQLGDEAINESHTKAELKRIKDGKGGSIKLRGLVDKYKGKIQKAKTAAEKKKHRDEIATIRDMLSDSYVPKPKPTVDDKRIRDAQLARGTKFGKYDPKSPENTDKPQQENQQQIKEEQLLNEIGETPAGQRALKLARARANAKLEWDTSVSKSFADYMGKPGDMEKVIRDIGASEKIIAQANKRIKPKDTVSERNP